MKHLLFLFLYIVSLSFQTHAATDLSSEGLEVKSKLESEIQKNLYHLISTQLRPDSFSIAVRVKVSTIKDESKKEPKNDLDKPIGMDLGAIDVREVLDAYEKEIEELKIKKEDLNKKENKFKVDSVEVVAAIDESYGPEYVEKFKKWLSDKVIQDFGKSSKAIVNAINFKNMHADESLENVKNPTEPSPGNIAKDFAPIIMATIIALAIIFFALSLAKGLKHLATSAKQLVLELKGAWNQSESSSQKDLAKLMPSETRIVYSKEEMERMIGKIAFVCLEIEERLNDLVKVWIDSGEEGLIKTAVLIDTIVNARERILYKTGTISPLKIPLDDQIILSSDEGLMAAYIEVAQMDLQDKIEIMDAVYWDLVSFKTLGIQSLRTPFDFMQSMSPQNITNLLSTQKKESQTLALMYLPSEVKQQYIKNLEESKKLEVYKSMLSQQSCPQKEIWEIDTSFKVAALNMTSTTTEKIVNLFPKTLEILESLDPIDEIEILRQVTPELPQNGLAIKHQYSTLSFVDEWKTEYVKKLSQIATAEEILTLIMIIPNVKESLLQQCPPKIQMIVEDDLRLNKVVDHAVANKKLHSLKSKWNKVVVSEKIPYAKILIETQAHSIEVLNVA